jgi:hypothetical protein
MSTSALFSREVCIVNPLVVLAGAVAAFVLGALWYSPLLFGNLYLRLRGVTEASAAMSPAVVVAEFVRWLVIAVVLARVMSLVGVDGVGEAIAFGGLMWIAIYTALTGSVIHEGTSWRLFAIHAGDGLVKVLSIAVILALWGLR